MGTRARMLFLLAALLGMVAAVIVPNKATAYVPALGVFWLSPPTDVDPPSYLTKFVDGWHGTTPLGGALDFRSRETPDDLGAYARGWTFTQTPYGAPSIRFWSDTSEGFNPTLDPDCTIVWQDIYDAFGWPEVASQWVASIGYMHTGNRNASMLKLYLAGEGDGTPYGATGYSMAGGEEDRVATQIPNPDCCRAGTEPCAEFPHVHSFVWPRTIGHTFEKNPDVPTSPVPTVPVLVGTWGWTDSFQVGEWTTMPFP